MPELIRLTLPAAPDYARLARLTAAGLATRSRFSYDEVEDLRVAVGEAFTLLVGTEAHQAQVELTYTVDADSVEVEVRSTADRPIPVDDDTRALSLQILSAVADHAELDDVTATVRVRKQRTPS